MNAAQRNRHAALLKAAGYEDDGPLTINSTDGETPQGRELSFAWLAGTVMTGLTSVLLMGGALFVSFQGQDTFSTAVDAIVSENQIVAAATSLIEKTDRIKPVTLTRSDKEIVEATIRESVDGGNDRIRNQPFVRVRATLATAATALSDGIPGYDPVALLNSSQPINDISASTVSTNLYGAYVDGEVAVNTTPLPLNILPTRTTSERIATNTARRILEASSSESGDAAFFSYAAADTSFRDLGIVTGAGISGIAENVSIVPKSSSTAENTGGRTERITTLKETQPLAESLTANGFSPVMIKAIAHTLRNHIKDRPLPKGTRLRILLGPSRNSDSVIPYRLSIYFSDRHAATVALTDSGRYVLALKPPDIDFPEEDTEEVNVNTLPTIYRSIWETGRKHGLSDETIERIIVMYAYDLDLAKRINPGDSIEILQTPPDETGRQDLLHIAMTIGKNKREFFRYRTEDGAVDFYDADGQTGKRFLQRRPLKGGGNLRSRYGNRRHPVTGRYKLHTGVDLAAPYGTPIYAGGDGVVSKASWFSGYGRYVGIKHVNGYETAYGHMSRIADGMAPGVRVRQGQIIGYVGSTGLSTGNHLHYEIKINGRTVDPLSVKLPRDKSLPANYDRSFKQTIAQIRDLMALEPAPITVASTN